MSTFQITVTVIHSLVMRVTSDTLRFVYSAVVFWFWFFFSISLNDPRNFTAGEGKERDAEELYVRTYVLLSISFTLYCYSKCILSPHVSNVVAVRGESDIGCAGVRARFSVEGVDDNFPSK